MACVHLIMPYTVSYVRNYFLLAITISNLWTFVNCLRSCSLSEQFVGEDVWTYCKYPNPAVDFYACRSDTQTSSLLCDPDGLLTKSEASKIRKALVKFRNETRCEDCKECKRKGKDDFRLAIALMDKMAITDKKSSTSCTGDCLDVFPKVNDQLNNKLRTPTEDELQSAAKEFSKYLRKKWFTSDCDNVAVILYSKEYRWLYTSTGELARKYLTDKEVVQTYKDVRLSFRNEKYYDALSDMIKKYKDQYTPTIDSSPGIEAWALALIILGSFIEGIILLFVLHYICSTLCCRGDSCIGQLIGESLDGVEDLSEPV